MKGLPMEESLAAGPLVPSTIGQNMALPPGFGIPQLFSTFPRA